MIEIKFIISVIIVGICTYLWIDKAKTYNLRVSELKKIKNALNYFKSKIEFTYEPIKEILDGISKSVYRDEDNIFKIARDNMKLENISIAWNNAIESEEKIIEEDKEILKMFGKLLGKTDKKGQINEINLALEFINNQIEKAEQEMQKNTKLYKSLGLIIGVGIVIIIWWHL